MHKSPKTTAGAIIFRKNGSDTEILLTKRNVEPFKGYWCIPGGHIEYQEKARDAAIREIREETNLDINPEFLCYLDEIFPEKDIHNVVIMFFGEARGELKKNDDEVSEVKWFTTAEALHTDLAFNHHDAIEVFNRNVKMI